MNVNPKPTIIKCDLLSSVFPALSASQHLSSVCFCVSSCSLDRPQPQRFDTKLVISPQTSPHRQTLKITQFFSSGANIGLAGC